jgi:4-hydroxy-tetrahydrodipicolinate reductase
MKVAVCGAAGRMGREVCRAVDAESDLELACLIDPAAAGTPLSRLLPGISSELKVSGDLSALDDSGAAAMIDFTVAEAARRSIPYALQRGINVVAGTTGLGPQDLELFGRLADENRVACLIAPNFAVGAVLMMHFAGIAARYMDGCEIIELHHPHKLDAPSGTAILTAERVARAMKAGNGAEGAGESKASRGEEREGVRIHSVRLPGLVAHQEVIFGGLGQTLTIRHDSTDRSSFMPGVIYALRQAGGRRGLTVGLENWMEL